MDEDSVSKYVYAARVVCWSWAVAHVSGVFLNSLHDERELREEARQVAGT